MEFIRGYKYPILQVSLAFYSLVPVFQKLIALSEPYSVRFFLYLFLLYACYGYFTLIWQQLLKVMPLSTAFMHTAITIVWGLVWGFLFFSERITIQMIAGAAIIIAGLLIVVRSDA